MGNYFDLIAAINAAIKTNGEQGITGASLNSILRDMVAALGAGYQYVGVVTPDAAAPSTDYNAVYLGLTAGTYTNFGLTQVRGGQFGVFTFNGSWTYNVADIASGGYVRYDVPQVMTQEQAAQARSNIAAASNADVSAKYTKPDSGIPKTDLAQAVQTSLGKADAALPASSVVDNLTTEDATKALSAKQGKVLDGKINQLGQEVDLMGEFSHMLSPNLFDKRTATDGYGVRSDNGALYAYSDTSVSDYIPVPSGASSMYLTKVRAFGALYWAAYDSSKNFTHGANSKSVTIQTGDAYIRFCCKTTDVDVAMAIVGTESDVPSEYMPFGNIAIGGLKDGIVTTPKMADGAVENSKVIDRGITIPKADFLKSTNLLDKNATDVALGKYINVNTGALANNDSYNTSGYIRVVAGEIIYFGSFEQNAFANFYAFYSKDKTFISGGVDDAGNVTVPDGAYFLRFTLSTAKWNDMRAQATIGQRFPYSVFHYMLDGSISLGSSILPCETSLGTGSEKATAASISDGEAVTIDTFPRYQLKGMVMSFSCNLTTFGSLIIGKGYQQSLGEYLRITASNVETIWCNLSGVETVSDTSAHGLTIASFLRVSIFYTSEGKMKYVITTASGSFTKEIYWKYIGENPAFVRSDGTVATDVVLSIGSQDLKKPVWAFGDSYMSIENSRWVGVMRNIGVFDFMVNALSGINSTNMMTDAFKAFAYGSPKFAIWGLGMNDGSDADAQTPKPAWLTSITSFINLCKEKNTIPILATIPCVPTINHEGKNAWVKASGYRYIDFAKAVNGDTYTSGVNNWYDGMLSSDNVHPTSIGAQALAAQVMVDFPEIMQ